MLGKMHILRLILSRQDDASYANFISSTLKYPQCWFNNFNYLYLIYKVADISVLKLVEKLYFLVKHSLV